ENKRTFEEDPQWEDLNRQDGRLWGLTVARMSVLGLSLLSFMFPTVFWFAEGLKLSAPIRAFVGFAVLQSLAVVYIVRRQVAVRRLRARLYQALTAAAQS